jgi:hypothetical protein
VAEGSPTRVMVGEHAVTPPGNAVTAPNRPAIDLGWTFHIPGVDSPWTWRRIPTSVITQLLFELRPCIFEVGRAYALHQVLYGLR